MDDTQTIADQITDALDTAAQCVTEETARNYSFLSEQLGEIENAAGRLLHSHVAYQRLLTKLRDGGFLATNELQELRSLIVGDAEEYLKYDDEFALSKSELARILGQIRQLQPRSTDPEALMHLRVLCREAANVLAETVQYLDKKERVRNFDEHTRGPLSSDTRHMLAGIVEDMAR